MKKLLTSLVFVLALSTAFGQSPWWVGGHLGINFTTVSGKYGSDDDQKHKMIVTPLVGLMAMYTINNMISINAELNMAKWGTTYVYKWNDEGGTEVEGRYRERYTSIQIPILARFTFGTAWQYFGYGGIYWSKILGGKYVDRVDAYNFEQKGKIKFKEEPDGYEGDDWYLDPEYNRRMDIGLNIGGGVQRELGPGILAVDLRFALGFLDSLKWPDIDKPDGYKGFKHRSLSLRFQYFINMDDL